MTQQDKERIEKEANKIATHLCAPNEIEKYHDIYTGAVAGATAEHERNTYRDKLIESSRVQITHLQEQLKQERNKAIDGAKEKVKQAYTDDSINVDYAEIMLILESLKH